MTEPTLTPSRLWRRMTRDQRMIVARAFWKDGDAADDQIQAALVIAQQKKFRPKTVIALDEERKALHLASIPAIPDNVAAKALVIYHLSEQRPMMSAFLDALGLAHDNGLIQEENPRPDPERIAPAAARIAETFPPDHVALYLNTLLCQDPETWAGLRHVPQLAVPAAESRSALS